MGRRNHNHNLSSVHQTLPNKRLHKHKDHKDKHNLFKKGQEHQQKSGHPSSQKEMPYIKSKDRLKPKQKIYIKPDYSIFQPQQEQVLAVSYGKLREYPKYSRILKLEDNGGLRLKDDVKLKKEKVVGKPKKLTT
jgi:hypothetical protein